MSSYLPSFLALPVSAEESDSTRDFASEVTELTLLGTGSLKKSVSDGDSPTGRQ
jgi:hypothetical protein